MSVYEIVLKTVASTVDLLIALIVILKSDNQRMKAAYSVFCLLNFAGIWC